jgi:hypothetical protein
MIWSQKKETLIIAADMNELAYTVLILSNNDKTSSRKMALMMVHWKAESVKTDY